MRTLAVLLCAALLPPADGQSASTRPSLPDVEVVDQDGQARRFYRDLVQGRTVVISFIFTSCSTVCPVIGSRLASLQALLPEDGSVSLVSISIDPGADTPERLRRWSERFEPRPGWTLVTGEKVDIDRLLRACGASAPDKLAHTPVVLVVNDATGKWIRGSGLLPAGKMAELVEAVR